MLVLANMLHDIQMTCVLCSNYYDLYPMDENMLNDFLIGYIYIYIYTHTHTQYVWSHKKVSSYPNVVSSII